MHEENPVLNVQIGGNDASRARLYIFVECALFLQSLFQQNKTNVSFREIARLIARNSLYLEQYIDCVKVYELKSAIQMYCTLNLPF